VGDVKRSLGELQGERQKGAEADERETRAKRKRVGWRVTILFVT